MAPRLQVAPVQFRETPQVTEQLTNTTYYQPEVKPQSQLYDLAGSLRNFSNDIGGYMDRHKKEQDDAAFIRGQAAALKANGADIAAGEAAGVRSGLFATFQSPEFSKGYKQTQGEIVGKKLASQFFTEYQQWDGRNNQDPAAFDAFLGDFVSKNLQTDDPDILKGALPFITATATAGYNTNQQDRSTALYDNSIEAHVASTALDIDNFVDQGIASGSGVDYTKLWDVVEAERARALSKGVLASDYDSKMLKLIADKALETGDPALLSLLENKVPGQDYTYIDSTDGRTTVKATLDKMETVRGERMRAAKTAQDAADKKLLGEAQVTAINALIADPNHVFDEEFLAKTETLDPKFRLDLKQWQENLSKPQPEDSDMILGLQAGIIAGDIGIEQIMQEMGVDGIIKSPATATQMINLLNGQKDNANQPLLTNQTYKDAMTLLQRQLTPSNPLFADPDNISVAANAARLDYQQAMSSWFTKNPDADYSEIATKSAETLKRVLDGVTPGQIGGEPSYATPDSMADPTNPNPLAETQAQQQATTEAAAAAEAASSDPMVVWQAEAPPAYDSLSEDQRSMIDERARAVGETTDNYITQLWGNLRDNAAAEAAQPQAQPMSNESGTSGDGAGLRNISYEPDASGFVSPDTNPSVNQAVLSRFSGRRLPVSIRNNNMGAVSITGKEANIANSWAARQPGFVGYTARPANEGGWYAKYATPEHGVAASSKLLENYGKSGVNTPIKIVTKWSADAGAHSAYAATLTSFLNRAGYEVTKDTVLDLSDPQVRIVVLMAKSAHESGAGVPVYSEDVFRRGANYDLPAVGAGPTRNV